MGTSMVPWGEMSGAAMGEGKTERAGSRGPFRHTREKHIFTRAALADWRRIRPVDVRVGTQLFVILIPLCEEGKRGSSLASLRFPQRRLQLLLQLQPSPLMMPGTGPRSIAGVPSESCVAPDPEPGPRLVGPSLPHSDSRCPKRRNIGLESRVGEGEEKGGRLRGRPGPRGM